MERIPLQETSLEIWADKYQVKDSLKNPIDTNIKDMNYRVASALAKDEKDSQYWTDKFLWALECGATPAGRILSNAGAEQWKPAVSLINCTVSQIVEDSMEGILHSNMMAGITLKAGCGIGYEWSTLRPADSFVSGAGAFTSGALSFMNIFDATCFTVSSAGGRRGAQMGTFAVWHPDVIDFIQAKRKDGTLRQFNLSLLIDKDFMEAVKNDLDWELVFPIMPKERDLNLLGDAKIVWKDLFWEKEYCKKMGYHVFGNKIECKVYKVLKARDMWDIIMKSTYDFAEPGFLLIDEINRMNNNYFIEKIRATNPCFTGDTIVAVADGRNGVTIKELAEESQGQKRFPVYSAKPEFVDTKFSRWNCEVREAVAFKTGTKQILNVVLSDDCIIKCTPEHLLATRDGKYVEAKSSIGVFLDTFEITHKDFSESVFVKEVVWTGEVEDVYDLTVEDNHNFYIITNTDDVDYKNCSGVLVHNCGEQPLPPEGSCLLGSINLALFVKNPFSDDAYFDWDLYREVVRVFSRMLDNVVEYNGLPLEGQRHEIEYKRRHGMGFTGVGSALTLLKLRYGSAESLDFTEEAMKVMAIEGYAYGIELAKEKGCAPIFNDSTEGVSNKELWCNSEYMKRIFNEVPGLKEEALQYGCRYTHATSIAPTGTISLTVNNNVSNGIEPSFAHKYTRNVIKKGSKSKVAVDVYSYEMLLYKHLFNTDEIPEWFSVTDNVSPKAHVDIQARAQKWCDSSISKTINVPTDLPFDEFKDIYMYAYDMGLKGCTTFRFNPEAFQGVLVKEDDLEKTLYDFKLEDGTIITCKGNDQIEYDGETHQASNLFDAIKEGYYGKF